MIRGMNTTPPRTCNSWRNMLHVIFWTSLITPLIYSLI